MAGPGPIDPRLQALRDELDQVDAGLIDLAGRRQRIVAEIGRIKQGAGRQLRDFRREREVLDRVRGRAESAGLDPDVAEDLLKRLIDASLTRQEQDRVRAAGRGEGRQALVIGGAGLLGQWLVGFLDSQGYAVSVADPAADPTLPGTYPDWRQAPLDAELVVVSTPPKASAAIIEELAERRVPGLVFDVGSIKSPLIPALRAAAGAGLNICSIHPMFGPDTQLLSGRHVLLMDVGCRAAVESAGALFVDTMAEVVEVALDQHDRLMALVLGLSHALNIAFFTALVRSGIQADQLAGISSTTFKRQLEIARDVAAENPDLYHEIQRLNEHGGLARRALVEAVELLSAASDADDPAAFTDLMLEGRSYLEGLGR
ncbi:prephenate dehydrogenase/arogenate dehydrogenase family protein [Wenzhouxiangella limi]|uniref:chorismate mutase n=1 Tax=Wenzhouxiangella limi TaxID=2707351 RepID=A0A845V8B8_9GAMM|nr:prephenate dehydrogenase/arogenate dehydrogenase family protein [Wenzhouxiangella limi]NDY96175.1 prephenate dehydrogenase/arogenate dehydrogenase family protein [Wenzhouxiangella limi]